MEGDEVEIQRKGEALVLRPKRKSWKALIQSLEKFSEDFMEKGRLIGAMDLLIAAHVLSLDVRLVTNNEREFSQVTGLRVENWVKSGWDGRSSLAATGRR